MSIRFYERNAMNAKVMMLLVFASFMIGSSFASTEGQKVTSQVSTADSTVDPTIVQPDELVNESSTGSIRFGGTGSGAGAGAGNAGPGGVRSNAGGAGNRAVQNGQAVGTGTGIANAGPGFGTGLGIGLAIATPLGNIAYGEGNSVSVGK